MRTSTNYKLQGYDGSGGRVLVYSFMGLSSDTKPTDSSVGNGSSFVEMDTGKLYFYDAENGEWKEWA